MSFMSLLLNVLWIVFGGFYMAAGWAIACVVAGSAGVSSARTLQSPPAIRFSAARMASRPASLAQASYAEV